jgi:hypothetical protein
MLFKHRFGQVRREWKISDDSEQRAALSILATSRDRGEADRARVVLLTLSGWTSPRIAEAFGVREDTARLWRGDFVRAGVDALKARIASEPEPVKSAVALRCRRPPWWPDGSRHPTAAERSEYSRDRPFLGMYVSGNPGSKGPDAPVRGPRQCSFQGKSVNGPARQADERQPVRSGAPGAGRD